MENNVNIELDSLREQMGILRNKLDKQEIINEQLMRKSMNQSMSWIQKYVIFEIILVPLLLIYLAIMHVSFGLSWWLYAFVAVMLIVSVSADYYINHLNSAELLQGDLVDTSRKLLRMKSLRAKAFIIGIVAVLVWVAWLMWELYNSYLAQADNHDFASGEDATHQRRRPRSNQRNHSIRRPAVTALHFQLQKTRITRIATV